MRFGRGVLLVMAGVIVGASVGGVAEAVTGGANGVKACATAGGRLVLRNAKDACAAGESAVELGEQGPAGARGPRGQRGVQGPQGVVGPQGDTGPAGTGQRINFSQLAPEASTVTHYLATSGPASLIASCQGSAAAPKLVLSVTGGTQTLAFTATVISSDTSASPVTTLVHGTTTVLGSSVVDTETTAGNLSDLVSLAINAEDGTQITGTIDVELNTATGSPACTVNGTIAAA